MNKKQEQCCCNSQQNQCNDTQRHEHGCIICGKPLEYIQEAEMMECSVCHRSYMSNARCVEGHFVCDDCHRAERSEYIEYLKQSRSNNPMELFETICRMPSVYMHGPEHHIILPCVLLTAIYNSELPQGVKPELSRKEAIKEAINRGSSVPGGTCGFWGVCGAAAGAGIFASIFTGSNPLNRNVWHIPQRFAAAATNHIADVEGPRCCKRTCRLAIESAVELIKEYFGISLPTAQVQCDYMQINDECIGAECPYCQM